MGALRLRLDVSDVRAQQLLSAAGARRFAYNWAMARIVANHAQWKAEESYGIAKQDRTRQGRLRPRFEMLAHLTEIVRGGRG